MSRVFDANTANFLDVSISRSAGQAWSMAAYFKADNTNVSKIIMSLSAAASAEPRFEVSAFSTGTMEVRDKLGSGYYTEQSSNSYGTADWHFVAITHDNTNTEFSVWLDSNTPNTDTIAEAGSGTIDTLSVGILQISGSPAGPHSGKIAQVAVWEGYELTNTDVQALLDAKNSIEFAAVQSGSLLCHYPLNNTNLSDSTSTLSDLGVTGTVAASTDDPLPTITSVSSDDVIGTNENPWTIAGSGFGTQ